jgi:O-antigen/teichoic acid export membrane protein
MPELKRLVLARDHVRYVLRFGAWMTVSNVISPLMVYVDRLVIGTVLSVAAVAYYATPFEVVIRLLTIPSALAGVLFPAFTMSLAHDRHRAAALFRRGQKYIFLALFPIILAVVTLAPDGLSLWLGSDFAQHSTAVLRLLAIGVFFNSLSTLPWILIQSAGRPDLTAKFHIVELALYLPVLFLMVRHYGLIGAAIAWAGRVLLDSAALSLAAVRFLRTQYALISRVALLAGACGLFMIGTVFDTATQRIIYLVAAMSLAAAVSLIFFLSEERRRWLRFSPAPRYDPQGSGTT